MATFYDTFITFAMIGLMVFAIFSFIVLTQNNAGTSNPIIQHPLINKTYIQLEGNLTGFENSSQSQKTLFEQEDPKLGFGTLLFFSIVSSGKVFNAMIGSVATTLFRLPAYIGIPKSVISVFVTILIITIILTLWILYKLGG